MNNGSKHSFENQGNGSPYIPKNGNMNNQSSNSFDSLFNPKELVSLLQRHIWLILFCVISFVSAAYYVVNYELEPIYESSGTMLVSADDGALPGSGGNNMGGGFGQIIARNFTSGGEDPVQSAIYLIQSREISIDVAKRLKEARKTQNDHVYPTMWQEYPEDSTMISDERLASRIRQGLVVEIAPPSGNRMTSNLLKISYESYSPEEAAEVVNLTFEEFQDISLEQKQNTANKALSFLKQKKQEVRQQLSQAEDRLVEFQSENKLVALDAQAGSSVNTLSQIRAEKQNLEIQLESINSSIQNYERQMEAIKPGLKDEYSKALGPTISNYQRRLAELRTERFIILSNNPQLKENPDSEPQLKKLNKQISQLENEIQSLSDGLLNEKDGFIDASGAGDGNLAQELSNIQENLLQLEIEKNQIQSQIQALEQRIKKTESFLDTFPDNQVKLARLETEVQRYKQLLENLIAQESEVALWQQTQNSSSTIIDHAMAKFTPVKPNKILWLTFAAMVGIVLPIGILIVKDSLSSTINSYDKLKSYSYPLLPVIYDHSLIKNENGLFNRKKKSSNVSEDIVFFHNVESPIAESYRKIVNQILYSNPDNVPNSMLITSSGQGEGKTTFTVNLAAAFAELDKKVLVIDCDFRRPALHKKFSLTNSTGIKEILFDGHKLSKAIRGTEIDDLHILTSGSKPVSPAKLLASKKFNEMIKVIKPNYDIILFDTPPQSLVSDVSSLISYAEKLIVIARFGTTDGSALKHTIEELEKNGGENISLALTCYKPSKSYDSLDTKGMHKYMYEKYYEYEKG